MTPRDSVELPGGAERITFLRRAGDTDGALLEMEALYVPRGQPPPDHYHPAQEERFECLAGVVTARVAGEPARLGVGDTITIPPGTRHSFWNGGDEQATLRWEVRPALRTEELFEQLGRCATKLQVARAIARHTDEFRLAQPPWLIQRPLMAVLRALP